MSTMFSGGRKSFNHGLGCEMVKLEIISLKGILKEMIRDYRIEKNALKVVMRRQGRGEDISNVNLKLFAISKMGYVTQIKELEDRIAVLKDNYHDLYSAVYTKLTEKEHKGGASQHAYNLRRGRGENTLTMSDLNRGVKGYGKPLISVDNCIC